MKLDVLNDSLAATDVAKMSVNVDNLTYSLMIDGIYTNKLDSVIRELSTNARDSHISAGNEDPFLISVKFNETSKDVILSIKDYGLGLSRTDAETYLCNLNSSSKRESNEAVGCFGIGSKSPFSLVDSYDFNCIKDGELTSLNLFRIKSETPRFLVATSDTTEPNSVECIVKLQTYTLEEVLQTIYTELALFDIKPKIKIKSERVDILLEPEDFFCTVIEKHNFFHLFYNECNPRLKEAIPTLATSYPDFFLNLKAKKKISCGIIGYNSVDVFTVGDNLYSVHMNLQDFYILKFGLDSDIKFDVSRENIVKDSSTDDLLKAKILNDFDDLNLEEAVKLKTLYNIICSPAGTHTNAYPKTLLEIIAPDFYAEMEEGFLLPLEHPDNNTDQTRDNLYFARLRNREINYNFLFSKLEESIFYYQNNLEELSTLSFISKTRVKNHTFPDQDTKSKSINYILNSGRSRLSLNVVCILEKLFSNTTVFWNSLYLKNILSCAEDCNFFSPLILDSFLRKERYSSVIKVKQNTFKPSLIEDLDAFKLVIITNSKRLKNMTQINQLVSNYKNYSYSKNTIISVLSGNKKSIVESDLVLNLNLLAAKDCVKIYDLEGYAEISSMFVEDIKYVAPPRASRPAASRPINTRTIINQEGEEEEIDSTTHNEFNVKLRNKLEINIVNLGDKSEEIMSTTSLKFFDHITKEYQANYYHSRTSLILVSKDVIKTKEEKDLMLSSSTIEGYKAIFEIDNEEFYSEIKDVCICYVDRWDFRNSRCLVLEFNSKFSNEDDLKNYSKILTWILIKNNNFKSYKNFIESVELVENSELFNNVTDPDEIKGSYAACLYMRDDLVTRKAITVTSKLYIDIKNPYVTGYHNQQDGTHIDPIDLNFKNISVLFNESLKDIESESSKNENYSKECFQYSRYPATSSNFFDKLNVLKLTTIDSLLSANNGFLFKRMFNQEYLETIEEEFKDPLISFNLENFKKIIKEY